MSRIGQTYNAKNEKIYPKIVIGSIISDPSVDNPDETNHAFEDAVGSVVNTKLANPDGVTFKKVILPVNGTLVGGSKNVITVGQNIAIHTDEFASSHINDTPSKLTISDASVEALSIGDASIRNINVTNDSYDILKQYRNLPSPSASYDGKVVQYIGPTQHGKEDGFVCYSMVKCVMGYDASKELDNPEYLKSDFDSFDSTVTHTWLVRNDIKRTMSGITNETYKFYLMWDGVEYHVKVENQNGVMVSLGGDEQYGYNKHVYCPYVWNADYIPQLQEELPTYYITFHTSTYVWKPQMVRKQDAVALQSISLSDSEITLFDGDTHSLIVTYNPANASNKKITWKSSEPTVAMVDHGIITAISDGDTTITAVSVDGEHEASCGVHVNRYIDVLSVSFADDIVLRINDVSTLHDKYTINPYNVTDPSITFTVDPVGIINVDSDNNEIISGDYNGEVNLTIDVSTRGNRVTNDCSVYVYTELQNVSINPSTATIGVNETKELTIACNPSTASINEDSITWVSSDTGVLTVDGNGRTVTVKGESDGDAEINVNVTDMFGNQRSAKCDITVNGQSSEVTDVIDRELTEASGTTYIDWSGKSKGTNPSKVRSDAIYSGKSAGGNNSVQITQNNSSGIISTSSGGTVKSIKLTWNTSTTQTTNRYVDIYARNTAYTSISELDSSIGRMTRPDFNTTTVTTYTFDTDSNYAYVGLKAAGGALYLDKIEITWNTSA